MSYNSITYNIIVWELYDTGYGCPSTGCRSTKRCARTPTTTTTTNDNNNTNNNNDNNHDHDHNHTGMNNDR